MPRVGRVFRVLALLIGARSLAAADESFVVLRDDGAVADGDYDTFGGVSAVADSLVALYETTDAPLPEVMSVWTTFPLGGSSVFTLFVPYANDVRGIGLDAFYARETFDSAFPPLRAMLLHNDVTALPERAARHEAPLDGYARYLFLLELSHLWGPALRIPGDEPDLLVGFPFHWSFWMDAGGSPSGGNAWIDNLDGTFTTGALTPAEVRFSTLDLYVMGLADADEVPPFGLLVDAVAPPGTLDPLFGDEVSAATFPWFADDPLTVTATRSELLIDDAIAATGDREPAFGESPDAWTLGIVLVVPAASTDDEIAAWRAAFEPIASSFAPAFEDATSGRGHLEVVTITPDDPVEPDAGPPDEDASAPTLDAGADRDAGEREKPEGSGCGCSLVPSSRALPALLPLTAIVAARRRRERS